MQAMKKMTIILIIMSLLIASCNQSGSKNSDNTSVKVTDNIYGDHSDQDPIPNEALTFDARIHFVNFTSEQQEKMEEAIEIIKMVVATEEFRSKVLNHTYNGKKTFVDNGGYSNAQIYQIILDGAERLLPAKNNTMEAEVELYYASTNVVGYTYASSNRIWVNTKYFNIYTAAGVAHNLFHEWMHKLGFIHDSSWSSSRDYSVPYALGNLVGEIGKEFL